MDVLLDLPAAAEAVRLLKGAQAVAAGAALQAGALDTPGAFPSADVAALAQAGLLVAPLPPELGGAGLGEGVDGNLLLAEVLMAIGEGSLPLGRLYEGHVNALQLVLGHGSTAQQRQAAAAAAAGELFGVWNTDDRQDPLRLLQDRLQGAKILASGAGHVTRPLVTAATPAGAVMLIPPMAPGQGADLSGWTAQGMQASATGRVDFSGMPAPPPIGGPGDYLREPAFSTGAWRCLAVQGGGMAALLALLRQHLLETTRDEDRAQRQRFGEAAIAVQTARLWILQSARLCAMPHDVAGVVAAVNLARRAVEQAALTLLELVHRSIGLMAFLRPAPVERIARDLATYLRQPAPDRALELGAATLLRQDRLPW
ncbi:acyl-CoA dehydrogenase family protein [Roseomonas sp. 18066]|uniref:acyl-CoA dehydrogenase family protein n=1 Tax=Roseomonas sp. 18066 TaxID=2681412 RepID=UPI001359E421|nr:acyl-CoA dehydrogenase family protein [Roseomonas sp. 18066]